MPAANGDQAVVDVKSAWFSKINWTQGIALLAMAGTFFGFDLDPKTQSEALAGIIGVQSVITWALKTFMKPSVTPTSVS